MLDYEKGKLDEKSQGALERMQSNFLNSSGFFKNMIDIRRIIL